MSDEVAETQGPAEETPAAEPGPMPTTWPVAQPYPGVPAELIPEEVLWQAAHNPHWPGVAAALGLPADPAAAAAQVAAEIAVAQADWVAQGVREGIQAAQGQVEIAMREITGTVAETTRQPGAGTQEPGQDAPPADVAPRRRARPAPHSEEGEVSGDV